VSRMINSADSPRIRADELLQGRARIPPELIPWRYVKGSTSATFGDFQSCRIENCLLTTAI
jgi:hypothetical protein